MSNQIDNLEQAVEQRANRNEWRCCETCHQLIEPSHIAKHPGATKCDFCSVVTIESGEEAA